MALFKVCILEVTVLYCQQVAHCQTLPLTSTAMSGGETSGQLLGPVSRLVPPGPGVILVLHHPLTPAPQQTGQLEGRWKLLVPLPAPRLYCQQPYARVHSHTGKNPRTPGGKPLQPCPGESRAVTASLPVVRASRQSSGGGEQPKPTELGCHELPLAREVAPALPPPGREGYPFSDATVSYLQAGPPWARATYPPRGQCHPGLPINNEATQVMQVLRWAKAFHVTMHFKLGTTHIISPTDLSMNCDKSPDYFCTEVTGRNYCGYQQKLHAPIIIPPFTLTYCMTCLLYTSPSPRDAHESRMPSSA